LAAQAVVVLAVRVVATVWLELLIQVAVAAVQALHLGHLAQAALVLSSSATEWHNFFFFKE
jgi:hypothetical protein